MRFGRMLSPDNFVQTAANIQGYNRYSYVLNNPLKYTDPTGEESDRFGWAGFFGDFFANFSLNVSINDLPPPKGFQSSLPNGGMPEIIGYQGINLTIDANFYLNFINTGFESETRGGIPGLGTLAGGNMFGPQSVSYITPISAIKPTSVSGVVRQNNPVNYPDPVKNEEAQSGGGNTPGIDVYETSLLPEGAGITLPPFGILVGPNPSKGLKQHEYGHYLQYKDIGFINFYKDIGIPSLYNGIENDLGVPYAVPHHNFRTETDANKRSQQFYNSTQPIQNWPTNTLQSPYGWGDRLILYWDDLWK